VSVDSKQVKLINTQRIKAALKQASWSSKNSLSRDTGLSVATCRSILEELLKTGEVLELSPGPSTGGRPGRRFVYNGNFAQLALVYLRREGNIRILHGSVINLLGEKLLEEHIELKDKIALSSMEDLIEGFIGRYPGIKALSIGIPGVVHRGVVSLCDYPELKGWHVEKHFQGTFNIPVVAENDVNCAALGFFYSPSLVQPESVVYLYYPYMGNAGGGIIINGKILRGFSDYAGEVSSIPLGVATPDQGPLQGDIPEFRDYLIRVLLSIHCLINPARIVISGQLFTTDVIQKLQEPIIAALPGEPKPEISFEEDFHDHFLAGLAYLAMDTLSCPVDFIEKSI
jgi:hypothetical protein